MRLLFRVTEVNCRILVTRLSNLNTLLREQHDTLGMRDKTGFAHHNCRDVKKTWSWSGANSIHSKQGISSQQD